jgi:hypothetical protein
VLENIIGSGYEFSYDDCLDSVVFTRHTIDGKKHYVSPDRRGAAFPHSMPSVEGNINASR